MKKKYKIKDIVLDFDGTCTQVSKIYQNYLDQYIIELNRSISNDFPSEPFITAKEWEDAMKMVGLNSPVAGWVLGGTPSAPAAADPFILADESIKLILRLRNSKNVLPSAHSVAYNTNPAPWREDAVEIFSKLTEKGIRLHFISNSSTGKIQERLKEIFEPNDPIMKQISVKGDAAKFRIAELRWEEKKIPEQIQRKFSSLPSSFKGSYLKVMSRPAYLRRGFYFEAIYDVFKERINDLSSVVFCGDIWELDLAMPYELGACIHLIERMPPFKTYEYELEAVNSYGNRAKIGKNLSDLLAWTE